QPHPIFPLYCPRVLSALRSFPTRRSSDLSITGAGRSGEAPAGTHSQPPTSTPSTSALTQSRVPGSSPTSPGALSGARDPSVRIRTGRAGESIVERSASTDPSGAAEREENTPPVARVRTAPLAPSTASTAP